MTVKPILFSPEMVRAILEGRKTQTRRVLKPQPGPWRDFHLEGGCQQSDWSFKTGSMTEDGELYHFGFWMHSAFHSSRFQKLPYAPGDLLYVREVWRTGAQDDKIKPSDMTPHIIGYEAECAPGYISSTGRLRAAMHMPRWASRITLKVTNVRVERVQDISEEDAIAEGCAGFYTPMHPDQGVTDGQMPHEEFRDLWNSLNTKRGYGFDTNPWVSAITFEPIFQNIDAYMGKEAA